MNATKVTRLRNCDYSGSLSQHKVCLIEADGEPHFRGHELDKFIWWDMKEDIPVYDHVRDIIARI